MDYLLVRDKGYKTDPDGTKGRIFFGERDYKSQSAICCTLERPWNDNKQDNTNTTVNESSCIPEGEYIVEWTLSPRLKKYTYEIKNVPNRDGIRIHAANVIDELFGCIAPVTFFPTAPTGGGIKFKDKIYKYFGSNSTKALEKLNTILLKKPFKLIILEHN